jgi:hypothetical protein
MSATNLIDLITQVTPRHSSIQVVIDGGGLVPVLGAYGNFSIPFNCTIIGWTISADQVGSGVVGVAKCPYAGFPGSLVSITGGDNPTLVSAQKNENLAVSLWTTAINAGDILQFLLNSVATCTRLNLSLNITIP